MFAAMKAQNVVEKEILRVVLGELDTIEARRGEACSDVEVVKVLRKLLKSNNETIKLVEDANQRATLEGENAVINSLLPQTLDVAAIVAALTEVKDAVLEAGNDGQATGIAMKHLKSSGAEVEGKTVSQAVRQMRSG